MSDELYTPVESVKDIKIGDIIENPKTGYGSVVHGITDNERILAISYDLIPFEDFKRNGWKLRKRR